MFNIRHLASDVFSHFRRRKHVRIGDVELSLDTRWKHETAYHEYFSGGDGPPSIRFDDYVASTFTRAGDVVVDVGANIGVTALLFMREGATQVHAFEPDPLIFERLASLDCPGIVPYPFALGSDDGAATLYRSKTHNQGGTLSPDWLKLFPDVYGDTVEELQIATRRLDSLSEIEPDILKVDAEGAELAVLKGAEELIGGNPPRVLYIELYDDCFEECCSLLASHYSDCGRLLYQKSSGSIITADPSRASQYAGCDGAPPSYVFTNQR